ncbi:peptidoglycan DD-metalloendopeptidase family protein [Oscillatoria salina]|uniref:peptidoglycan DD-metalloendopeptidase family protein n=1 Tax=Oscillatoria salina TaxID=331517 RepID=UPI0013B638CA|nr:peptidoglycan DD-metalloendopeptidase family protein [Oscillatoria salina]MBZ8180271.1 peptidoglycan DD-metalloendopeptidase family protein [Oscillatoria salina IIICB1]NET87767.1 peptidoglycan DD-metalloendopeptidase family protein [Kamptonema sp. SIO1D9]
MKRENIQKAKPVTSCPVNYCEALAKPSAKEHLVAQIAVNEGQRRARTSAAMIGLAISMGATGILLPKVGDEAIAADGSLTNLNLRQETADTSPSQSARVAISPSPSTQLGSEAIQPTVPVVKHQVQKGETLWQVSQNYKVEPAAIATSNQISSNSNLSTSQKLEIPVESLSGSSAGEPTQVQPTKEVSASESLPTGGTVAIPGQENELSENRQQVAVNNLTRQQERLDDRLNQLQFEKPEKGAKAEEESQGTETAKPIQASNLAQSIAATESSEPVLIPVPTPGNNEASVSIPIQVELPESTASETPTAEEKVAKQELDSVSIPVESPETTARESSQPPETANSNNSQSPVVSTIPSPEKPTTKPQQNETESVTIPELVVEPQQTAAVQSFRQNEVTPPVVLAGEPTVYQVRPGDTLNAIARRHGLSAAELIQENNLTNPHLIKVDQQLRIPRATTARNQDRENVAIIPGLTPIPDEPKARSSQSANNFSTIVPTEPLSDSSSTVSNRQQGNNPAGNTNNSSPSLAAHLPSVEVQTYSESHASVEKLKADILRMRQEYQAQQQVEPGTTAVNISVEPPATNNNVASSTQVNPEWQSDRTNSSQAELTANEGSRTTSPTQPELVFNQEQPELVVDQNEPELVTEVEPEVASEENIPEQTVASRDRELVAVAPAPVEEYNPMLQIPVGEMVSPDLPPLSPPEEYLPDSPARFNGHIWPAKGVLTSGYGMRWGRMHKGIDIAGPVGTPIVASAPGEVVTAGWNSGGYGNLVEVKHPDGSLTRYAHNSKIIVRRGQNVTQGQLIAEMGSTGYSTGPHLHFEVHPSGRGAVNPMAFLPKRN